MFTDNSVVFCAIIKGRSKAEGVNAVVREMMHQLGSTATSHWVQWVASEENVADNLTRSDDITDTLREMAVEFSSEIIRDQPKKFNHPVDVVESELTEALVHPKDQVTMSRTQLPAGHRALKCRKTAG